VPARSCACGPCSCPDVCAQRGRERCRRPSRSGRGHRAGSGAGAVPGPHPARLGTGRRHRAGAGARPAPVAVTGPDLAPSRAGSWPAPVAVTGPAPAPEQGARHAESSPCRSVVTGHGRGARPAPVAVAGPGRAPGRAADRPPVRALSPVRRDAGGGRGSAHRLHEGVFWLCPPSRLIDLVVRG